MHIVLRRDEYEIIYYCICNLHLANSLAAAAATK